MRELINDLRFKGIPNNKEAHKRLSEEFELRRQQVAARAESQTHEAHARHIGNCNRLRQGIEEMKDNYYEHIRATKELMRAAIQEDELTRVRDLADDYTYTFGCMSREIRRRADEINREEQQYRQNLAQIAADKAAALALLAIELREAREMLWRDAVKLAIDNRESILQAIREGDRFDSDRTGTDSNREKPAIENN